MELHNLASPGCLEMTNLFGATDIPRGVYDLTWNEGWVSVGVDHDTAQFAAETLRRWWQEMGSEVYPAAQGLLITADSGGSNSHRSRLWKVAIQELADLLGFPISVCHFPPGTSKWNQIEHRMFCHRDSASEPPTGESNTFSNAQLTGNPRELRPILFMK